MAVPYAHSRNDRGQRHNLVDHLQGVGRLASQFAANFQASEPAYFLGLWHDLGKFHPAFQSYLLASEADPSQRGHGPDHKAAGTKLAHQFLGPGSLLIHGHHGGLRAPNHVREFMANPQLQAAAERALDRARQAIPDLEPVQAVALPQFARNDPLNAELFLRLMFSALIDADSLDTEEHFAPADAAQRVSRVGMEQLWEWFCRDQQQFSSTPNSKVGEVRDDIFAACLAAAEGPPGIYRLTVPTGGGKTRSGMAFALRHALRHGHQRVIVAVPYISITEQTADVYRDIFRDMSSGNSVVLEHHSGETSGAADEEDFHPQGVWQRLASENWDSPIIVTTTVQLFESLFANGRSKTRKLHRLARSIIILDEAQSLPSHLLEPILDVLQRLCAHFGTTVVLSTATQPAFEEVPKFASLQATEIVPRPERFFHALRRVAYDWRTDRTMPWDEAAELIQEENHALVVVNTKRDAIACLQALDDPDALHLSTLLCGAHRRRVLSQVRERLKSGQTCHLVSTQVIEAGVDLDFPLVLRAVAPLDSIIQAAGRCNREGLLERGRVIVFEPESGGTPPGAYTIGANVTRALVASYRDADNPEMSRQYFREFLQTLGSGTDRERIQESRLSFDYPEVARKFRIIDDAESVVITTYGSADERRTVAGLLAQLRQGTPQSRLLLRRLQPYVVSLRTSEAERYRRQGLIAPVLGSVGEWRGAYHPVRGLVAEPGELDMLVV